MLLKIFGCGLIVLSGFAAGYMLTKRLSARRDFFEDFCVFLSVLKTQIRYNSADIFTLINLSAKGAGLDCLFSKNTDIPFSLFWQGLIDDIPKLNSLNNSDKELLIEVGLGLGTTDIEGQLKHIELYQRMFQNRLEESKAELGKKSAVYKALGLFGGISAAIIIL